MASRSPVKSSVLSISASEYDQAAQAVRSLLTDAVSQLSKTPQGTSEPTSPRFFFPSGIELLKIVFKVGANIDIELIIAGENAPKETATLSESRGPIIVGGG